MNQLPNDTQSKLLSHQTKHQNIRGTEPAGSQPGIRGLIVFVGEWFFLGTSFLGFLGILGLLIRFVTENGIPGPLETILMGCCALFVVFMLIVTGGCLLKSREEFCRDRQSPQSRSLIADTSGEADSPETCLACGKSMPINGETCSACGWSYLGNRN